MIYVLLTAGKDLVVETEGILSKEFPRMNGVYVFELTTDGETYWYQKDGQNAIWYSFRTSDWRIGAKFDLDNAIFSSSDNANYQAGPEVPKNWFYKKFKEWKNASGMIVVRKRDESCLHFAARTELKEVCKFIISRLENANPKDKNGTTPLHITARNKNLEIFQEIIENVEDVGPKEKDGTTPLHIISQNESIEFGKLIMKKAKDPNPKDGNGTTPLHILARNGNLELFKIIFDEVDDIGPKESDNTTPLHIAIQNGNIEMCKLIMSKMEDMHSMSNVKLIPTSYTRLDGPQAPRLIGELHIHSRIKKTISNF